MCMMTAALHALATVNVDTAQGVCCCSLAQQVHMVKCKLQSEAQSVTDGDMGEEEDEEDTVDEEDGLKGDSVWDPDHATPWRPRRSRRNTSQLTAPQPSRLLPEKVCPDL